MNLQSSFTYDNWGRRTSRTLQQDNTTVSTIANILAKHFKGHVVGALGKINFDGGDPYSPDKKEFITYDGTTNTQNSLIPPECCCDK